MNLVKLKFEQEKAAMIDFKERINEAIQELKDGKKYINNAKEDFKKAYTGKAADEKRTILEKKVEEINNIIKELQNVIEELDSKIFDLNNEINKQS